MPPVGFEPTISAGERLYRLYSKTRYSATHEIQTSIFFKLEKKRVSPVKKDSKIVKHTTHSHKEKGCRKKLGLKRKPVTEAEEEEEAVHHLWKVIRRGLAVKT